MNRHIWRDVGIVDFHRFLELSELLAMHNQFCPLNSFIERERYCYLGLQLILPRAFHVCDVNVAKEVISGLEWEIVVPTLHEFRGPSNFLIVERESFHLGKTGLNSLRNSLVIRLAIPLRRLVFGVFEVDSFDQQSV